MALRRRALSGQAFGQGVETLTACNEIPLSLTRWGIFPVGDFFKNQSSSRKPRALALVEEVPFGR